MICVTFCEIHHLSLKSKWDLSPTRMLLSWLRHSRDVRDVSPVYATLPVIQLYNNCLVLPMKIVSTRHINHKDSNMYFIEVFF